MTNLKLRQRIPGYIGSGFMVLATSLWIYWGFWEMYWEGWWGAWYNRLPYLVPGVACLILTLIVLTWPRFGGWLIIITGGIFTIWWWYRIAVTSGLTAGGILSLLPVSGLLVVTGVLFLYEERYRRSRENEGWTPPANWFRRNLNYGAAIIFPLVIAIGISIYWLPILVNRLDDGERGTRLIQGNGITLLWAPAGPGWSERYGPSQAAGELLPNANLSWNDIAFYGISPTGFVDKAEYEDINATIDDMENTCLCRYLSKDGLTLMDEAQDIWRMPTVDEIVRSLVRDGENAGCSWDGKSVRSDCTVLPDKETPLWIPDRSPIYYWTADEFNDEKAYYVGYNGVVRYQSKSWGNPRHGYRCVREP